MFARWTFPFELDGNSLDSLSHFFQNLLHKIDRALRVYGKVLINLVTGEVGQLLRVHVKVTDNLEVIQILKKLNIREQCRVKYQKLYPNVKPLHKRKR